MIVLGLGTVQSPDIARPDLRTFILVGSNAQEAGPRSCIHQLFHYISSICASRHISISDSVAKIKATGKYDIYQGSLRFLKYVQIGLDNSDVKKR